VENYKVVTVALISTGRGGIYRGPRRGYRLGYISNTPSGGRPAMEFGLH
jgi:hypothetical protein